MKKVMDFLLNSVKLTSEDTVVVGVSGGPDSMVLLYLLVQLRKKVNFKIVVAHVNHNVRVESKEEKVFIENWCKDNDVTFEAMVIEKYSDDNFHNEARTIRYNYFEDIVKKYQANYLMTAHHGDDLTETILMRIVRGSTLKGYSGFQNIVNMDSYKLVRPLVFLTKKEIEDYAIKMNIPYRIDKSNFKDKYTRNRYRHTVLPFLKNEDKNVHDKFIKFSNTLYKYSEYIDGQTKKVYNKVYDDKVLKLDKFNELDDVIKENIIYKILESIYQDDLMIVNDKHVDLILDLIASKKRNCYIYLPNNIKFLKEYNILKIVDEIKDVADYEIEFSDYAILPNKKHIEKIENTAENGNDICRLSSNEVEFPLYVRTRKLGDKIDLNGMTGHKKVKDIFIDKKVPIEERELWPILVDSKGKVLWIPGIKKSKNCKKKNEKCDIILKYY